MAAPMRGKSGPTQAARDKHGMSDGAFPVWDQQSADDAINLRHNSPGHSAASVLRHVAQKATGMPGVADKLKTARAEDRGKKAK